MDILLPAMRAGWDKATLVSGADVQWITEARLAVLRESPVDADLFVALAAAKVRLCAFVCRLFDHAFSGTADALPRLARVFLSLSAVTPVLI